MVGGIGLGTAFIAGVLSFLTPCVLPVLPGYVALLGGLSVQELAEKKTRHARLGRSLARVTISTLAFTVGVALVFMAFGVTASALGAVIFSQRIWLQRIGGLIIILLGLQLSGWWQWGRLERSWQFLTPRQRQGPPVLSAFILGLVFALGWTPCFGPVLGAILTLAAATTTAVEGGLLLAVYAFGIGAALLVFSVLFVLGIRNIKHLEQFMYPIKAFSGLLLIILGIVLLAGWFNDLSAYLISWYGEVPLST